MAGELTAASRSERLLAATRGALADAAAARLITEITEGRVDEVAYARYLLIEEGFVHAAARVLGAAVWHAPSWEATVGHARSLHGLVTEQRAYFARARADWPVRAEPGPAGLRQAEGLAEHVLRGAADHGYPAIVTAMFAAEHLYLTWCSAAAASGAARPATVQNWVDLHARAPFTDQVAFLRAEVDALPADVGDSALAEWFTGMLREEIRFHDAVYLD
ncbi:thiaminase/transcriptional activator TenA [Spinactinospora alkalitolerans]|uniref:Thiaminase/transcriptional activator TenA n=1 Tax=Spinactinospora alkalitolerans TaxID=687207 RepID=A0A852TS04_9ACTN|nr:TenA family protein [Spinactinospora alkalitolerans]NYE46067.1 thiaminase/transcriptional activator TenA [Spinactinospora alkalitolerans]